MKRKKFFDIVIGNPPYQDESVGDQKTFAAPIYNVFLDSTYKLADKVEMIHPARFLFNAGSTPRQWNKKMLDDKHLTVLLYERDSSKIFPNTDIKGGIAITYRDSEKEIGPIGTFTIFPELDSIMARVQNTAGFKSFSDIVITRTAYKLTDKLHEDHPEALAQLSDGHAYDMSSNIFERLPQIFFDKRPNDDKPYIQILGRENNERIYKWIRKDYVNYVNNLNSWKLLIPSASNAGHYGEVIAPSVIVGPGVGNTETFTSIGNYDEEYKAVNVLKFTKTKFARSLLGLRKTTQALTPEKWKYVPLQDFTANSDIDWSKSISEIDQQLYKKYGLDDKEIEFIETHVKSME